MSGFNIFGDTSGSITVQAPAVAGSSTLTLPTTGGNLVANTGWPQIIYTSNNTNQAFGTTYANTGISAVISPRTTSSRVLITTSIITTNGAGNGGGFRIMKNGVLLFDPSPFDGNGPFIFFGTGTNWSPVVLQFMDSPGTTSPTTYTIQARSYTGSGFTVNPGNPGAGGVFATSTMVLTEVIQ
jgi:hypothetical protein